MTKIVFIGAGSVCFGLNTLRDLFSTKELKGCTLSLVDINEKNLKRMYDLALKMNEASGMNVKIEAFTDRKEALPSAEFIISSLAIERCDLWKKDFLIPKKYGIRHTLGENGGPGGLFFSMRTIPVIMDIARDIEEICPEAYFINFSNPESRIILALSKYTNVKCMGLCHGVFMGMRDVSKITGIPFEDVDALAAGLNHFQWFLQLRDKKTNKDLYPLLREKSKVYDSNFMPISRKLLDVFGKYPSCSDDHIGEYLAYGYEGGEEGYDFDEDERGREILKEEIKQKTEGKKPFGDWLLHSPEKSIHVVTGILNNTKQILPSGIVYNRGAITNLPYDAAVEVPVMLDAGGIHPITIGNLPDGIANLCKTQISVQQLAVDAAVYGSKEIAMQCLLNDPVVNSIKAAEGILKELWEINEQYIRKCLY